MGSRSEMFMDWWAAVNAKLTQGGCSEMLFGIANSLYVEGVSVDIAVKRESRFQKGDPVA